MNLQKSDLLHGFRSIGLSNEHMVLVHSSLSSFGYVEGGADTVIGALTEIVGPDGTVIVPTLTGKITDSKENPPVFDVRNTPCWTGKIPETFRLLPDARRSLHPTHSVSAIGRRRDEIIEHHETGKSPCDNKSPYYKNVELNGYIMLIGVDQESNTTVHCCEELAKVPYHLQKDITEINITGYEGETITVSNKLHDWYKPHTDFNKFDELFESHGIMKKATIGKSTIRLIKARDMAEFSIDILTKNPLFLLAKV